MRANVCGLPSRRILEKRNKLLELARVWTDAAMVEDQLAAEASTRRLPTAGPDNQHAISACLLDCLSPLRPEDRWTTIQIPARPLRCGAGRRGLQGGRSSIPHRAQRHSVRLGASKGGMHGSKESLQLLTRWSCGREIDDCFGTLGSAEELNRS